MVTAEHIPRAIDSYASWQKGQDPKSSAVLSFSAATAGSLSTVTNTTGVLSLFYNDPIPDPPALSSFLEIPWTASTTRITNQGNITQEVVDHAPPR